MSARVGIVCDQCTNVGKMAIGPTVYGTIDDLRRSLRLGGWKTYRAPVSRVLDVCPNCLVEPLIPDDWREVAP